ncbi:c-type cytochrome [Neptunomonas phycophila]|uniref:c-type cytochrome n=1 Tax=Neptunomonas phycophila TaxID=1572645 RepID=UPI0023F716AA|nr:cytochrome c [Neptunomonas phycophila]
MKVYNSLRFFIPVGLLALLAACSKPDIPWKVNEETQRWYSKQQVTTGEQTFKDNCATCHGAKAQGQFNWQKPDAQGNYPPPPLNGKAHAWHHPYPLLMKIISEGGKTMPAWQGKLTEEEMTATIAYFQSYWPDKAYELWVERHKR